MSILSVFDIRKQLTFYGSYHHHPANVLIHEICVPIITWSTFVLCSGWGSGLLPPVHLELNPYMVFDFTGPSVYVLVAMVLYFGMEPLAALLYTPQMALTLLTATAFSYRPHALAIAGVLNTVSWIAMFAGHYIAEGRSPALFDNLLQAFILAPFFVHLEVLFMLGYNPELHKTLEGDIQTELSRIHASEGEKRSKKGL